MGGFSILTSALPVRKVTVWVLHTVFLCSLGREGKAGCLGRRQILMSTIRNTGENSLWTFTSSAALLILSVDKLLKGGDYKMRLNNM